MKRKAIIIGATGLVGKQLVRQLSLIYDSLIIIARKPPELMCAKMQYYQLGDFSNLKEVMGNISLGEDTDAFTCFGTTKKLAGSEEAFRRVDFDYNLEFAKQCHAKGVERFFLLSALGADINSRFFYSRVKAELESAIIELGFDELLIFRPSLLLGKHKRRPVEAVAQKALTIISPIVPKSLGVTPISAKSVAAAMVMTAQNLYERNKFLDAKRSTPNVTIIDNRQLLAMTQL